MRPQFGAVGVFSAVFVPYVPKRRTHASLTKVWRGGWKLRKEYGPIENQRYLDGIASSLALAGELDLPGGLLPISVTQRGQHLIEIQPFRTGMPLDVALSVAQPNLDHAEQILDTLESMHDQDVAHSNAYPGNWLVTGDRVYLIDFKSATPRTPAERGPSPELRDVQEAANCLEDISGVRGLASDVRHERIGTIRELREAYHERVRESHRHAAGL